MAVKQFYHDIDLAKVGQLLNARAQVVTDVEMTALAATLGSAHTGLFVYNTDQKKNFTFNGTSFIADAIDTIGDVIFKGIINTTNAETVEKVNGFQYVVDTAGTLAATGVTFSPNGEVDAGDIVLFTSATTAHIIQRNDVNATETVAGNVELATAAETTAGTDTIRAVTPAGLAAAMTGNLYTRQHSQVLTTVDANTPVTVTHGLALVNRDAFVVNVMAGNAPISVEIDSLDANSITITSNVALTDVRVTVVGASTTEFAIA